MTNKTSMATKKKYTDEYEDLLNTIEQENSHSQLNVGNVNGGYMPADDNFELSRNGVGEGGNSFR